MIIKKLAEFKERNVTIAKDGKNPHFKSSYSTLNEVLSKIEEPLKELKVFVLQMPSEKGLRTILIDLEDESQIEGFMPYVEATTAQKLVANNTYNRRVSLVTMLGLQDEDDDGNTASTPTKGKVKVAEDDLGF